MPRSRSARHEPSTSQHTPVESQNPNSPRGDHSRAQRTPPREGSGRNHNGREIRHTAPAIHDDPALVDVIQKAIEGFFASRVAPTQHPRPRDPPREDRHEFRQDGSSESRSRGKARAEDQPRAETLPSYPPQTQSETGRPMHERLGNRPLQGRLGPLPHIDFTEPAAQNPPRQAARPHATTARTMRDRLGPQAETTQHNPYNQTLRSERRGSSDREVTSSLNIERLAQQVAKINRDEINNQDEESFRLSTSPFNNRIQAELLPIGVEIPRSLPDYDGTGCPFEHRRQFEARMTLYGFTQDMMARLFAMSLRGNASHWFYQLTPGSIANYQALIDQFLSYFRTNRRSALTSGSLFAIVQQENESLRDYWRRFNVEALKVRDLTLERRKEILYDTLRNDRVRTAIILDQPETLEELSETIDKYCRVEEIKRYSKPPREGSSSRAPNRTTDRAPAIRRPAEPRRVEKRTRKGEDYNNPFKHPLKTVYSLIKGEPYVTPARPFKESEQSRASRYYCEYHQQGGHSTDRCVNLQKLMQSLLDQGYLREFLRARDEPSRRKRDRSPDRRPMRDRIGSQVADLPPPPPLPEDRHYINTISGGPSGGDSRSARDRVHRILQSPPAHSSQVYSVNLSRGAREPITFSDSDLPFGYDFGELEPDFPLVIIAKIANSFVKRVLVDTGSSVNIMSVTAFNQLHLQGCQMQPCNTALVGFHGSPVRPKGVVRLPTTLGEGHTSRTVICSYIIVDVKCEYNVIFGRVGLNAFDAIPSTKHLKLKWSTMYGVGEVSGNLKDAWRCYQHAVNAAAYTLQQAPTEPPHSRVASGEMVPNVSQPRGPAQNSYPENSVPDAPSAKTNKHSPPHMEPDSHKLVPLDPSNPARAVRIGTDLEKVFEVQLISFLRSRAGVFAWSTEDLVGIDPRIAEHRLNIDPAVKPVRQKRRIHSDEKNKAITAEVGRLLKAGHIMNLWYADWLCNVVMVAKKLESGEKKWRMCVDFTDLNRHCPKDCYPLPSIDQLVDSTAGCELLSMMDASQGYYQVSMAPEDRAKTAFITNDGVFGFNVMPFGLKNAGATYQRLVNRMFAGLIGKSMEVYVDDMLVKSLKAADHLGHLKDCFDMLDKYRMKLNPHKCSFGVRGGKFLGYVVNEKGIEANPDKIKAILDLPPPSSAKQVQRLVGKLIALNRFISHSAEKNLPLFKVFRKGKTFDWTEECDRAFQGVKAYLSSPPLLAKSVPGETLFLYLAVSRETISSVLIRSEGTKQFPIYYLSRVLTPAEKNYPEVEKAALSVVNCARKLRHYFQAHKVIVLTNFPLKQALTKFLTAGRMVKWAVELGEHEIEYHPRTTIKAQALADFLIPEENLEPTTALDPTAEGESSTRASPADVMLLEATPPWLVHVDGSANGQEAGVGVMIRSPEGVVVEYAIHLNFRATNNETEYEAAILGLQMALELKATRVCLFTDSDLVKKQTEGTYLIHEAALVEYNLKLKEVMSNFEECTIDHLTRNNNQRADALSKFAIRMSESETRTITLSSSSEPAIKSELLKRFAVMTVETTESWMTLMTQYLSHGTLPADKGEARNVKHRSPRYQLEDGTLYKRGFNGVLQRCLSKDEAESVLNEIHEGHCGNHSGYRSLVNKVLRSGYFWITLVHDCARYVQRCDKCQRFAHYSHCTSRPALQLPMCCPFDVWGIDIVGPFPLATGQRRFILLAIDHYSKFVEAQAMSKIASSHVVKFLWTHILCRYGVPRVLISDNGPQFAGKAFQDWCGKLKIKQSFTSVGHPQSNGLTEVTNKTITEGIKKRLNDAKGSWADELDSVLWSYRTTPHSATKETPFSLVYGSEALIPAEIAVETLRVAQYDQEQNSEARAMDLDLLECKRDLNRARALRYKATLQRKLDKHLRPRSIQVGDLVLKKVEASKNMGKLDPPWEGPYKVKSASMTGHSFKLQCLTGEDVPRSWNIKDLRKFYY